MKLSLEKLRHHFPDQYERKMGNVKILPTKSTSVEAHYQHWLSKHQHDFIEIKAWNDSDEDVTPGCVLVYAALSGDEDKSSGYWMVKTETYLNNRTEFGYIISPADEPRELC